MIVTLGILSIFQLAFLPGLVLTRLVKLQGVWINILFSIALSPIINYLFVFAATALGLYNQRITLIFFGIELAFLIYLIYPILNKTIGQTLNSQEIATFFKEYLNKNDGKTGRDAIIIKIILVTVFSLAIYYILNYVSIYATQEKSVFTAWDAVVSWDRWAVDWYNNRFPTLTWHYPQLIPTNWSLTYQFMGDSRIKFFAKDFMGFIEIYILLTIFILGITKRQPGYFISVIFTAWLQLVLGSRGNGFVDSSVAFFALSSVACLLIAEKEDDQGNPAYNYIGAIFAAGAAVTKQAGLWVALAYPFLLFLNNNKKENRRYVSRYIPGILMIYALMIFPWYGYKEYQIQAGNDGSEIQSVTSMVSRDKSYIQTIGSALNLLNDQMATSYLSGKSNLLLLSFLMLFSCDKRFFRGLIALIIIPFTLIWLLFFSYDYRNFNLVVPIIGLTAGIGLERIIERIMFLDFHLFSTTLKSIKIVFLIIPIFCVFLLPIKYPDRYIIRESISMQKDIGDKRLNRTLYKYQSEYGFDGKILTDYQYLGFLPGLKKYYELGFSNDPSIFLKQLSETQVGYALLNSIWMSPEVVVYVRQNIAQGRMQIIFEEGTFLFVTTCRGPCEK